MVRMGEGATGACDVPVCFFGNSSFQAPGSYWRRVMVRGEAVQTTSPLPPRTLSVVPGRRNRPPPTPFPDTDVIQQVGIGTGPLGVAGAQVHTGIGVRVWPAHFLPGMHALRSGWLYASPWQCSPLAVHSLNALSSALAASRAECTRRDAHSCSITAGQVMWPFCSSGSQ